MRIHRTTSCALAFAVAFALARMAAGQDAKAEQILADARKAIAGKKLDGLTSLSVQAAAQRNVGNFQLTSDVELLLNLPDKYVRLENSNSPSFTVASTTGFNGNRPIKSGMTPGGGMFIRMGGPGMPMPGNTEKPTPEQQAQLDKQMVRSAQQEISRLMLGWFAVAHPSLPVQFSYAGEAESPDGKAFILDVKGADGYAARLFIDKETHLPLMVTYQGAQGRVVTAGGPPPGAGREGSAPQAQTRPANPEERRRIEAGATRQLDQLRAQPPAMVEYALYFDDWREHHGIKFPYSLRRASAGTTIEEWTISKVLFDPKIDPKKFDSEQ